MALRRSFQGFLVLFEDRFYAVLFGAFGVAVLWCARDVERKQVYVDALAGAFLIGGIGRLISVIVSQ
jgi:hypothetical protein